MEILLIILAVLTAPIWFILLIVGIVLLFVALKLVLVFAYVLLVLLWALVIGTLGVILTPFIALAQWIKEKMS